MCVGYIFLRGNFMVMWLAWSVCDCRAGSNPCSTCMLSGDNVSEQCVLSSRPIQLLIFRRPNSVSVYPIQGENSQRQIDVFSLPLYSILRTRDFSVPLSSTLLSSLFTQMSFITMFLSSFFLLVLLSNSQSFLLK